MLLATPHLTSACRPSVTMMFSSGRDNVLTCPAPGGGTPAPTGPAKLAAMILSAADGWGCPTTEVPRPVLRSPHRGHPPPRAEAWGTVSKVFFAKTALLVSAGWQEVTLGYF